MSKPVKELISAALRERYRGVEDACVVDITGLTVTETERIRGLLREKAGRLEVVKNSLARRAFRDTALAPLGDALEGPCALVTSSQPIVDMAKVLVAAAKEFAQLTLKQAIVEGDAALVSVEALSRLKGRRELVGEIAMLVSSPGRALAGCLTAPQGKLAGCLKAMIDRAS